MKEILLPLWLAVAWIVVIYLAGFGLTGMMRPRLARKFLFGFAQSRKSNAVGAVCRGTAGLAFAQLDDYLDWHGWARLLGGFLILTAALMLLFPGYHQRLAPRLVGSVVGYMPLVGLASIVSAAVLAFALIAGLE